MELKDLLLKKEELPILHESCFEIPIHPKLLDPNLYIKTGVAENCFNELLKDWNKEKELINYYKAKNLDINIEKNPGWHCLTREEENGLVTFFSISRDFGGSLYFDKEEDNLEGFAPGPYNKFSKEKAKEFSVKEISNLYQIYSYKPHNIDFFPGALFLRNWAINYMNEIFKDVFQ